LADGDEHCCGVDVVVAAAWTVTAQLWVLRERPKPRIRGSEVRVAHLIRKDREEQSRGEHHTVIGGPRTNNRIKVAQYARLNRHLIRTVVVPGGKCRKDEAKVLSKWTVVILGQGHAIALP
jgi:hypothetical protein